MKKFLIFLTINFLVLNTPLYAISGGGTVVGNGAGLVEGNFQFAYSSIEKIIQTCFKFSQCSLSLDEHSLLEKIIQIVQKNSNKNDRLIFLSEKDHPDFFTTGPAENHRIAKTFLNSDAPIYINSKMLYDDKGTPTLSLSSIIRIIIHELGHQAGVENHLTLDILGSKLSTFFEITTASISYKISDENTNITFSITNFEFPTKEAAISFNWKNKKNQNLTKSVISKAQNCPLNSESYRGIEITNGHYSFNLKNMLSFEAWLQVSCYDLITDSLNSYRKNLSILINNDFNIMDISVE